MTSGATAAIRIIPVGILRSYSPAQEPVLLQGWAGRPVRDALQHLGIPSALVGAVLVDGQLVQKDHAMQDGEEIKLIPLIGGG